MFGFKSRAVIRGSELFLNISKDNELIYSEKVRLKRNARDKLSS